MNGDEERVFVVLIAALTGHADFETRERGLWAGFVEYLAESLEIQWSVEVVSVILENKKNYL